ncbi:MAG TPA: hypothetical protein VFJ58_02865 [Armatimonadota bacterium]|nr:hypothetical protein [Armatimonadota bacterium]
MSDHGPQEVRELEADALLLRRPAGWLTLAALLCVGTGLIGFGIGLWLAPNRTWAAMLVNVLYWTGLAQAAIIVSAMFNVVVARWGRPIQRMTEGLAAFLPFALLLFLVLWFGRDRIWVWVHEPGRNGWFRINRLFWREGLMLLVMTILSLWYLCCSIRPDLGALYRGRPPRGFAALITRGWRGLNQERARSQWAMRLLSPCLILGYTFGFTMWATDLAMSLYPNWKSSMFGGIYWESEFYAALAAAAILTHLWMRFDPMPQIVTPRRLLDLSNLIWGFGFFWAYFAWSQYLVIWMGNIPAGAHYLIEEWREWPWTALAWVSLSLLLIIPSLLFLARGFKSRSAPLAWIAGTGALGVLSYRFLDVMPYIANLEPAVYWIVEAAITIGFAGAVALPYLWLMRRVPIFPASDPLFVEAIVTEGVEG